MNIEEMKESLGSVIGMLKDQEAISPENQEKVRENLETISEIVATINLAFGDGIDWQDVTVIGKLIGPVMKLASSFDDYKGQSKRQFVIEVVWLIYKTIDTYPKNGNNINIPFLVGPLERKFERIMISFAAGMAVDALYERMKKGGEV